MSIGSVSYGSKTIPFLVANMPAGTFDDEPVDVGEELTTPGVNGRRWRTIFKQFPSFQMVTVSESATYAGAQIIKANAEQMVQKLVTLACTIDNVAFTMKDVHVSSATARLFPGPVYGAGAGSGLAHAEITWQFELTDFDP
jgi:hypothetical protein